MIASAHKSSDCGHHPAYEVEWVERRKSGAIVHVWFCIACNYYSVSDWIKENGTWGEPTEAVAIEEK